MQFFRKKICDALFCVRRGLRIVTVFVVLVLETVAGVGIDLEVRRITVGFHLLLELVDGVGADALVLPAEIAQNLCFHRFSVGLGFRQAPKEIRLTGWVCHCLVRCIFLTPCVDFG